MKKILTSLILTLFLIINIINISFATDNTKVLEQQKIVDVSRVKQFDESIQNQITEDKKDYKLINVNKQENFKTISKNKIVEAELVVTTKDRYEILTMFDSIKNIEEEGYKGTLELDINSLDIKINDSYTEEYKVYLQKSYTNVKNNDINSIPKTITQYGIKYYLINPVWEVAEIKNINGGNIPIRYNGIMYYEGIKTRTVIKDYLAKINYTGAIAKKELESITYTLKYEEIEKRIDYTVPVVASASIVFFSGLIILRRKNVRVYNYNGNQLILVKKLHINKNQSKIDITPFKTTFSNKYKLVFSNGIYKHFKDKAVKIKYFDKEVLYSVKAKAIELFM